MKIKLDALKILGIAFLVLLTSGAVIATIVTTDLQVGGESLKNTVTCVVNPTANAGDYTTIQGCFDSLTTGGTVVIKRGTYAEETNLTKSGLANVTVKCENGVTWGNGTDATWLNITSPAGETYTDFTVEDCEFYGLDGASSPTKNNVFVDGVQRFTMRNIHFDGSNGNPNFNNVQEMLLDTLFLSNHRTGVSGRTIYSSNMNNIFCRDGWDNCIDVGSIYGLNMNNIYCRDTNATMNMDDCVYITNPNFDYTNINNLISEGTSQNCLQLYVYDSAQEAGKVNMANSWCYNSGNGSAVGIDMGGTATRNITDVHLNNVHVINSAYVGIRLNENVSDFSITNCEVKDSGRMTATNAHGIAIYRSYNGMLDGNVIVNHTGTGAMPYTISTSSDNINIGENTISQYTTQPTLSGTNLVQSLNSSTRFGGDLTGTYDNIAVVDFTLTEQADAGGYNIVNIEQLKSKYDSNSYVEMVNAEGLGLRTAGSRRVYLIGEELRIDNAYIQLRKLATGSITACNATSTAWVVYNTTGNCMLMCDATTWQHVTTCA